MSEQDAKEIPVQEDEEELQTSQELAGDDLQKTIDEQLTAKEKISPVYIDDLEDAIVDGKLASSSGKVVIEKWYGDRYLGTSLYKINRVDEETGDMYLHDEEYMQSACANFKTGEKHGWRFKVPTMNLNLNQRARSGPPQKKIESKPIITQEVAGAPKKRGRPKGSKNRTPQQIAADFAQKAQERREKVEARGKRWV